MRRRTGNSGAITWNELCANSDAGLPARRLFLFCKMKLGSPTWQTFTKWRASHADDGEMESVTAGGAIWRAKTVQQVDAIIAVHDGKVHSNEMARCTAKRAGAGKKKMAE